MAFARSMIRHAKLLTATAFALGMLTSVSHAYTQEQEQMCTGDAMRLCSSEIPDVDRVTACMIRQRASQQRWENPSRLGSRLSTALHRRLRA